MSGQLAALRDFGVAFAQGYLVSRAVPLSELPALLADGVVAPGTVPASQA